MPADRSDAREHARTWPFWAPSQAEAVEAALDELAAIARESSIPMSDLVAGLTIRGVR